MKPRMILRSDTFKRDIFDILQQNGVDTRYIAVYCSPETHTVTLASGELPYVTRQKAALKVLKKSKNYTRDFFFNGRLTTCIIGSDSEPKRIGSAYCANEDNYDASLGRAIAFEKALYGKVVTQDLLLEDCK